MKIENALPEGYQLHQYRIAKTIGGGGFSIVYLARNGQNGQWVVIKEYLPDKQARVSTARPSKPVAHDRQHLQHRHEAVLRRGMALSKINHPNIVRVVDFFRENNTVYMVMSYEDGKDLRWYIKRHNGRMTENSSARFFPRCSTACASCTAIIYCTSTSSQQTCICGRAGRRCCSTSAPRNRPSSTNGARCRIR